VTFGELQRRLVAFLEGRVRSGQVTERGLARLTGISQPHMHNVLKGKRLLSADTADAICKGLKIDLLDLLDSREVLERIRRR
jgi:transcriptional regulator with XRE-family HTH domain